MVVPTAITRRIKSLYTRRENDRVLAWSTGPRTSGPERLNEKRPENGPATVALVVNLPGTGDFPQYLRIAVRIRMRFEMNHVLFLKRWISLKVKIFIAYYEIVGDSCCCCSHYLISVDTLLPGLEISKIQQKYFNSNYIRGTFPLNTKQCSCILCFSRLSRSTFYLFDEIDTYNQSLVYAFSSVTA